MNEASPKNGQANLAESLLHFLGSLGQRSEAELYLRTFRAWPGGRFAVLLPTRGVLEEYCGSLAEQLRFLALLGLFPTVVAGALDEVSQDLIEDLRLSLEELDVASVVLSSIDELSQSPAESIAIVSTTPGSDAQLAQIVGATSPRKIVFLRRTGGLGVGLPSHIELSQGHVLSTNESGILTVNLRSDGDELRALSILNAEDARCLERSQAVLEAPGGDARATVSVASPLSVLRELFTVRGAGTLVKLGSAVRRCDGFADVDLERLRKLIDGAFGRKTTSRVYQNEPLRLYLESDYRGVALLEEGRGAAFLSKFAVLPIAQGEGLGQDIWWALSKETPRFYLRARPQNPINTWYASVCDGMYRAGIWNVYWKGIEPDALSSIIDDAVTRPVDFE